MTQAIESKNLKLPIPPASGMEPKEAMQIYVVEWTTLEEVGDESYRKLRHRKLLLDLDDAQKFTFKLRQAAQLLGMGASFTEAQYTEGIWQHV